VRRALDRVTLRRRQAELLTQLRTSERRYALAARGANDGLWDWDIARGEVYYSPRWKQMVGCSEEGVGCSPEEWLTRIHDDDRARVRAALQAHLDGRIDHFMDEHRVLHKDGTYRWMLSRGIAERDDGGVAVRMAGSQTDVTDRRIAEQQMQYDALHDPVTFLPNRTLFLDRIGQAMARAKRREEYRFSVILLDLDRFKIVNESLGHSVGDQLLAATARRLEGCLRAGDTAARLGGDEFAIMLEDVGGAADAVRVAERVQAEVSVPLALGGQELFTTASIGIVLFGRTHERPEDLLRDADLAMYRAKSAGRAQHIIFDPAMHTRAVRQLEMDSALRRAIDRREFIVYYQPIVALDSGRIAGFEALVRWQHPERGLVPPMEFIPTAEEIGLIVPISDFVIAEAVAQLERWQEIFGVDRHLHVSVNLSSKHLAHPGLVPSIGNLLLAHHVPPSSLRLEITESAIMENSVAVESTLVKLKALDIQLYMDDFGTGYSSLSYLHRLPIDTLKIDRSFVSSLGTEGENSMIVHTIVTLARVLGLEVVGEGIETAAQLAQLRALKCDQGQGFLFSRPVPAEKATELLTQNPEW
jgi:diguanylate cyclase (GGDEF)-like protein/PAS domain S-box-containing protein